MTEINKLLEKYWKGETSIEEERIIKKHFQKNDAVGNNIEENTKALFSYFQQEKQITLNKNIEAPHNSIKATPKSKFVHKLAIAASLIFIIGLGYIMNKSSVFDSSSKYTKTEIQDPDEARKIAKNALALLAFNFNKGEQTLSKGIKNIDKINIINSIIKTN